MKIVFLALVYDLSFNALAHVDMKGTPAPKMRFASSELGLADAVPTQFLQVLPEKITGFTKYPAELKRMQEAFEVIETVINSNEFKKKVINFIHKKGVRSYVRNNGLTNEGVYEAIIAANELIADAQTPGEMNFNVSR